MQRLRAASTQRIAHPRTVERAYSRYVRFDYLDSLRALAALAVTILHAFEMYGIALEDGRGGLTHSMVDEILYQLYHRLVNGWHYAVEVFIVLSGYSLMISVARSADEKLNGGVLTFLKRRMRRILPPYYAALALSLFIIATVPGMNSKAGVYWDLALPAFAPGPLISHLLLVHNMRVEWFWAINPPMWSIAVEWQIYFLFPLLILVWRKWGSFATCISALIYTAVMRFFPYGFPLSHSWYVELFTFGMLAASISCSHRDHEVRWRENIPWGWLSCIGCIAFFGFKMIMLQVQFPYIEQIGDCLLGVAVSCLLIALARRMTTSHERKSTAIWLLEQPGLVSIGHFSYSLYLFHAPVLALSALVCRSLQLPITQAYLITLGLGVPLAVLASYIFYLAFERPFLSNRPRSQMLPSVTGKHLS